LRAESEEIRNRWLSSLTTCIEDINKQKSGTKDGVDFEARDRSSSAKHWKKGQQDANTMELLKKSGFQSKDDELSAQALKIKIKYLNPVIPDIKTRIHYGFMNKKHKKDYLYQKRWFFLMSSRPLSDEEYEKDEQTLFKNPTGINLETLYYYCFDGEDDESKPKGEINMK
jgi:hypothetical protein